ncbi:hypothetical protein [Lysinibacillus piscis]|uniref:Uncharacterized protein n=1 Tax=Lysinibacillus piscis TaxID=2518931 RepID=A0ABQ5NLX7_9BACI|nr:hypothetical protein [Lysinibacillus sp. KH24]GLC89366.1 hypothetical protein LYSBPC_24930 [Lysinibacillus sp. KH24]
MTNNLIKNETNIYYTVQFNNEVVISKVNWDYQGQVFHVQASRKKDDAHMFQHEDDARKVANYVRGKLIEHTRTEVITEITKVLEVSKDEC